MEIGKESPPLEEKIAIEKIVELLRSSFLRDYSLNKKPARRSPHAKGHGCVRANFTVDEDIPEELRIGIFRLPKTYTAWIRFSNGSPSVQSDYKLDVRGMAIKLMDVPGDKILEKEKNELTQDFVMVNHPVFFVRNAIDFSEFSSRITGPTLPLSFFFGWNPFNWRLHEFRLLVESGLKWVSSPLAIQYWSQTPYKFGSSAIKFSVKPSSVHTHKKVLFNHDRLRQVMAAQLQNEVSFEFLIQLQTCPIRMPIEDATIVWPDTLSRYQKVATIKIPPQNFNTVQRLQVEENLSFTPWHSLPDHRPLGGINRARRRVYELISDLRHQINGVVKSEPKHTDYPE